MAAGTSANASRLPMFVQTASKKQWEVTDRSFSFEAV
jgi:hypothetical protein